MHGPAYRWPGWPLRLSSVWPPARPRQQLLSCSQTSCNPHGIWTCAAAGRRPRRDGVLLAVSIRVAGHRALDRIAHAVPGISRRAPCVFPLQARRAACCVPLAGEIRLDVLEAATGVFAVRIDAVAVGGAVVVEGRIVPHVRTALEVLTPVRIFDRRVDGFGDALAGEAANDRSNSRSDHRADRTGDASGSGSCSGAAER